MSNPELIVTNKNFLKEQEEVLMKGTRLKRKPLLIWVVG